jgi:ribonucleoside-diphosphate reductase alpha chain
VELEKLNKLGDKLFETNTPTYRDYVVHKFKLRDDIRESIACLKPEFGYGGFGEFIFYSRYSRIKQDGGQETWNDCIIRVMEGVFSIRKDWYIKNNIEWDENAWQEYAAKFGINMFNMYWLPPGRGLWAMGTNFIYQRGSAALYNCSATTITDNMAHEFHWIMDMLMNGVGVGVEPIRNNDMNLSRPNPNINVTIVIGDSREEWCDATKILIESYMYQDHPTVSFDYSKIRPKGLPIKGFGGVSSGPEPLEKLHNKIRHFSERYIFEKGYDSVMYKTDIANCIGCCVVAGNVRRSAQIAIGKIEDEVFLNLKDYTNPKFAYRAEHGWMSNNSVRFETTEEFDKLPEIADRVKVRGEPGFINGINLKLGRIGKYNDSLREDTATIINPCGEIELNSYECCNLASTLPTRCPNIERWYEACADATFYTSTVALLPTHRVETNKVIIKNRRIGVGIIDWTGWRHTNGLTKVIKWMRNGYKIVVDENKRLAAEAGVPESIRHTTIAPGGTIPKLAGRTSGIGYPTCKYTLRRVRVQQNSALYSFLVKQKIPHEKDFYSDNTEVFEYPIIQGPALPAQQISIWEQAMNIVTVQREWANNAVSNTIYFKPKWRLISEKEFTGLGEYENALESVFIEYGCGFGVVNDYFKSFESELSAEVKVKVEYDMYEKIILKVYEYDLNHEEDQIESVLACIAPLTKSVSLCPHSPKIYPQLPEEEITEEQYNERLKNIGVIDWTKFSGSDGVDEMFCVGETCEIRSLVKG